MKVEWAFAMNHTIRKQSGEDAMAIVIRYSNSPGKFPGCYCQLKFQSGERVLISFATQPDPGIKVMKLLFFGIIPIKTIWKCTASTEGGKDQFVQRLCTMFADRKAGLKHPLDSIRDLLLTCNSISEARDVLLRLAQPTSVAISKT